MLVCPNCQFENPGSNKFCQQCGTSLIDRICMGCGAVVSLSVANCPHCGTQTGQIWRALLSSAPSELETLKPGDYLDAQQRYCVLEPGVAIETGAIGTKISTKVLDCQPFQPPVLAVLVAMSTTANLNQTANSNQTANLDQTQASTPEVCQPNALVEHPSVVAAEQTATTNQSVIDSPLSLHQLVHAKPYLDLQGFDPAIPAIHDAWVAGDRAVLLLEDRSTWKPLRTCWVEEAVQPLQLLAWMQHMVQLWAVLEPHQACQSLLDIENLRVNSQGELGLQQLDVPPNIPPNIPPIDKPIDKPIDERVNATAIPSQPCSAPDLADLGKLWYQLFQSSQRTQIAEFIVLCHDLIGGTIISWDDLRSRLDAIVPAAEMTSDPPSIMTSDKRTPRNPAASSPAVPPPPPPLPVGHPANRPNAALSGGDMPTLPTYPDFDDADEDEAFPESDELPTAVLPMRLSSLDDAGRTDVGRQRDHNEDCYSIQTEIKKLDNPQERLLQVKGLYILCDGMGGHAGGEVASALAVDSLRQYFASHWQEQLPEEAVIKEAILQANQVLFEQNQKNSSSGSGRMGTTLALMLVHDSEVAIAHVGDSRIYRYSRRQGLEQLTIDHEVGQREIQRGVDMETAYGRPDAYQLTQALGPRNENFINPEVQFLELTEDQLILLCSDGLTDNGLLEFYWESHLDPLLSSRASLEQGVCDLIELANQHNGHDNITVIAVRAKVQPYILQK